MIANAVVSVYGFLVLFLPSESLLWRLVVALDMVNLLHINFLQKYYIVYIMLPIQFSFS